MTVVYDMVKTVGSTHVVLVNHLLGGGRRLVTPDRALVDVEVHLEDLESSQQEHQRHRKHGCDNHRQSDTQNPVRVGFGLGNAL